MTTSYNISDLDIQALVDNELEWEEQKRVIEVIQVDPSLRKRYEQLRYQKELLKEWWKEH